MKSRKGAGLRQQSGWVGNLNCEVQNFRERLQKEDKRFYCPPLLSIRAVLDFTNFTCEKPQINYI